MGPYLQSHGEFTKKAFLNGRIDLSQAEAVIELINSKTEKEAEASINQLEGYLKKEIDNIKAVILEIMTDIEASIDYPEYDIEEVTNSKALSKLDEIELKLEKLEKSESGIYVYNFGSEKGYSVLDLVKTFEKVNNIKINYKIVERRPGDLDEYYADSSKAREELGWKAEKTLEDMCRDSWNFMKKQK